jgi:outer membrane biosynthesis protein TonB
MSKKLTGKTREELIPRWLAGEEDALWQVKPTKREGKYIITSRRQENSEDNQSQGQSETEDENTQEQPEEQENLYEETPAQKPPPKVKRTIAPKAKGKGQTNLNGDVTMEILNQLRLLGEERREREIRKRQKAEIKAQIAKQMNRYGQPVQYVAEQDEVGEEEEIVEYQPQYYLPQRRTINLMGNRF